MYLSSPFFFQKKGFHLNSIYVHPIIATPILFALFCGSPLSFVIKFLCDWTVCTCTNKVLFLSQCGHTVLLFNHRWQRHESKVRKMKMKCWLRFNSKHNIEVINHNTVWFFFPFFFYLQASRVGQNLSQAEEPLTSHIFHPIPSTTMELCLQGSALSAPLYNTSMPLNASENNTVDQFTEINLYDVLGPKRSPFFLPVTTVYLLIFLTGLSGNLLTCAVIAQHKRMRNPTNLYLVSLAVSDLLVLMFGMPLEIYDLWQNYPFPFGEGGCYFKTFLFETVCFASILNVTALSVERYIAVVHPLKTRYLSTNQHAKRVITVVWVVSMICAIPNTSLHGIFYLPERREESAICTVLKPLWIYNLVMQITTVCFYFIPMTIISILYLVMGIHLGRERRHARKNLGKNCCSSTGKKFNLVKGGRRQVIKMLCE